MYCWNCGTKNVAEAKFCTNCGTSISGGSGQGDTATQLEDARQDQVLSPVAPQPVDQIHRELEQETREGQVEERNPSVREAEDELHLSTQEMQVEQNPAAQVAQHDIKSAAQETLDEQASEQAPEQASEQDMQVHSVPELGLPQGDDPHDPSVSNINNAPSDPQSADQGTEGIEIQKDERKLLLEDSSSSPTIRSSKTWLYIAIAALLLLVAGAGGTYMFISKQNKDKIEQQAASSSTDAAATDASASGGEDSASAKATRMNVEGVDITAYPLVTLRVNVDSTEGLSTEPEDYVVTENGIEHKVKRARITNGQSLAISYETRNVNGNPGQSDERAVKLSLGTLAGEISYPAPQPQMLSVGDISYNTDQYPKVKLYFSLYDGDQQMVDSGTLKSSFFKFVENNQEVKLSEVAKVADIQESLSTNVVIDVSSSMTDIIDQVKQQAIQFVNQSEISNRDRIALMSFAGATEISQQEFTNDKSSIVTQIASLDAYGECTALYRSIEQAVHYTAYNGADGSKYVVVFTDGGENCSNVDFDNYDAVSPGTVINSALQLGVPIYAVGVAQDDELQRIAKETNGEYISIGSDLDKLGQFYESIYAKKKAQYVATYTSAIQQKSPRGVGISVNAPLYYSKQEVEVTPRLVDDPDVARVMEMYQVNWSAAMSSGDMSYLEPYVVVGSSSPNNVYGIVQKQVKSLNEARQTGSYYEFGIPIYQMIDAKKVSDNKYQLKVKKHFTRTSTHNGKTGGTVFKETAYTYNVVKQQGNWLVDSTVESKVPEVCYTDDSFSKTKKCN